MQLSLHAGRVQLHVLYNYDNINNTRSYYGKESAASPPRDQRQHAQFAE